MIRSIRRPVLFALVALLLAGCARRDRMPPVNVGYDELQETFTGLDFTPLKGRRILLDPGHGGVFPGVVGRDGLSEADANLGVSLYLRGLLEAAGAEVLMTRTTDRDFVSPADSSLAVDLAARVALCDSVRPDVFLSLHHNSNAALDRDMNETQTYYPVGREGADLDLARCIHRHLVRNLGIRPAKIMAGNFYVLRNAPTDVPSVLGEPSMLSNPLVEEKLVTAEKMELEAQAYFLGLVEYFAGGTPTILPHTGSDVPGFLAFQYRADPLPGSSAPGLDPSTVRATNSTGPLAWTLSPDHGTILVDAASARGTDVTVSAANIAGRWTTSTSSVPAPHRPRPGAVAVDWLMIQEQGRDEGDRHALLVSTPPLIDHTVTILEGEGAPGAILETGGPDLVLLDDIAPAHHLDDGEAYPREVPPLVHESDTGPLVTTTGSLLLMEEGFIWMRWADDAATARTVRNRLPSTVHPIRSAMVTLPDLHPYAAAHAAEPVWLERDGHRPFIRTSSVDGDPEVAWAPVLPSLSGRTIILDPAGGGPDAQGLAPMGTPGRELNLRVADRLAALLRGAGANPILTRTDASWVPKEHKVLLTNREHGNLFLTIARNTEGADTRLFHHYGSTNGERWARLTAAALNDGAEVPVGPSYAYLLRHTAPPALRCELPMPATEDAEDIARSPAAQQAEALALFRAIVAYFEGEADLPAGWDLASFMARHRTALPHPDDVTMVRVDGNWLWLPPVAGEPAAPLPSTGGPRTLEVRSGEQWWLFEADPEADTLVRKLYGVGNRVLSPEESEPPRPEVLHAPEGD